MHQLSRKVVGLGMLLALTACGGGGGDEPSKGGDGGSGTTPPVTTPIKEDIRYIAMPYGENQITDFRVSKWNASGASLDAKKITWNSTDYGVVVGYDLNSIASQISDADVLQFSVKVNGSVRSVAVPFSAIKLNKQVVQLNEQTSMLSAYIMPAAVEQHAKMLQAVSMMDTNQDQKVTVADIAFYDHVYFKSSPIANNTANYQSADIKGGAEWVNYFNSIVSTASNIAPFRELASNAQRSTITLQDGPADLTGIVEMQYRLSCQSPELDKSWFQPVTESVEVPAKCSLFYAACMQAGECGVIRSIYFSDKWYSEMQGVGQQSTVNLVQSVDLDTLKTDPVFMQKYAAIQSKSVEPVLMNIMTCQLLRAYGAFCSA